jgi:phenylacetate-CoA ligase
MAMLLQLEQTQYLPAEELRRRQFLQLHELVTHAQRTLPFYGERLARAGIAPGAAITEEMWSALPLLTRREVQEAGAALMSAQVPAAHGEITADKTSGSRGMPLQVKRTVLTQFFWNVLTLREELWHGRDIAGKFAAIRRDDRRPAGHVGLWATTLPNWGPPLASIYPTGPAALLDIRCSVAEQVAWLQREAPDYLLTFGVNLHFIARHCLAHRIALPSLKGVRSSGEVLSESAREACRAAWSLEVADIYSAVETGYIALPCPETALYHVQAEGALIEILDATGRPCAPGEVGQVVVTPLHNFAMPLLRYAIGDDAEVGPPCSCGRTLPTLRRILGRSHDMVVLPSGERRFPYYGNKTLADFPAIIQHQLVQKTTDRIDVRLVTRRPLTAEETERIRTLMQTALGHPFEIAFVYCDAIERSAGGKFEEFRCEVPA